LADLVRYGMVQRIRCPDDGVPLAMPDLDRRLNAYRDDLADSRLKGKVAAARFTDGTDRQVTQGTAPLRKEPGPGTALVSELLFGERVRVFEEKDGVAWVQNATDGYVGYTDSTALSAAVRAPTHVVAAIRTSLYPEPDIRAPVKHALPLCAPVSVTGTKGRYAELATGGWVPAPHLAEAGTFESDPVAVAARLSGSPYVWGGRSSLGLDCSALVQLALARCGINAPRDSDMQEAALGTTVAFDGDASVLRHGDLVFWKGHVGIFVAPDRFLHCNARDMAVATAPFAEVMRYIEEAEKLTVKAVRRL
jgi:cell wall-associated NlpC family hydrolase